MAAGRIVQVEGSLTVTPPSLLLPTVPSRETVQTLVSGYSMNTPLPTSPIVPSQTIPQRCSVVVLKTGIPLPPSSIVPSRVIAHILVVVSSTTTLLPSSPTVPSREIVQMKEGVAGFTTPNPPPPSPTASSGGIQRRMALRSITMIPPLQQSPTVTSRVAMWGKAISIAIHS